MLLLATVLAAGPHTADRPFAITVVDAETGRGVPLVELRTTNGIRHYTDSNGVVAFREPGLLGRTVFFHVRSHGYEFRKDGFGYRGVALKTRPGGSAKLTIRRLNIAQRLYRVTGAGIYRDSNLAGIAAPIKEPLLVGRVVGCDSVLNAVYRGKVYWFWGDTVGAAYPLGNFHASGATSGLPGRGGLDPDKGIDFTYFVDQKGFAQPMAQMPGKGPTWLTAVVPLSDRHKRERLYAAYVKVQPPLTVHARGLAVFDDEKGRFEHLAAVDLKAPAFPPHGHAFRHSEGGTEYVYFAHPFPLIRVRATAEDFAKPESFECYTCLRKGSTAKAPLLDRDRQGRLRYAWRRDAPVLGPAEEARLLTTGKLKAHEARWQLRDRDTGKTIIAHAGSVCWNAHRRRWVMIAVQIGGSSFLGEVWYAEADTPLGPWAYAVKVVTHDRYSFYNPKQHPMFDRAGGRVIFFEGTYTNTFSGNSDTTPRYDYNQVLYRLDLGDSRLALPVAIYDLSRDKGPAVFGTVHTAKGEVSRLAFFAPDRPLTGTVPVLAGKEGLRLGKAGDAGALFHAFPAKGAAPSGTVPLWEYRQREGTGRAYSVDARLSLPWYERAEQPLCRVWSGGRR
jgi:hypothetical protein